VKEIMRVCLSDNGKEILMYNGDDLERVVKVTDFAAVGETAKEAAESAFIEDFETRNGRHYMRCMGYEDCAKGMCDVHFEMEGAF
jgi:hypothetical protein